MKILKNKKRITTILAIVSVLALALGSLAYFTDRVTGGAFFKTADPSKIINVTTKDDGTESVDPGADLEEEWKKQNVVNPDDPDVPAPLPAGSAYNLSYKLTNLGEKIDVRETIMLTIIDPMDADLPINKQNPEWRLFSGFVSDTNGAKDGNGNIAVEKIHYDNNTNQIKYEIAPYVLDAETSKDLAYQLILNKFAGNDFQASTCKVEVLIEARQHVDGTENTYEAWEPICTSEISFGGISNYPAVPGA